MRIVHQSLVIVAVGMALGCLDQIGHGAIDTAGDGGSSTSSSLPDAGFVDVQPSFPIRGAFYYPWFPETWGGTPNPYTHYHPTLGFYNSDDSSVIQTHLDALEYGKVNAAISSWWGQGHYTDQRLAKILSLNAGHKLRWAIYYEKEGNADPSVSQLSSDLAYLQAHYGSDPSSLRINGKMVVFAYADSADGCAMVDRWKQANTAGVYVVLKVFSGYTSCKAQPDGWHQYAPANAADSQTHYSYSISPGFWKADEADPRLVRDLTRWEQNIRNMVASGADFQLVTTFSEWGEGTAVESASEWASASGFGSYLDALHNDGQVACTPTPCAAQGKNCGTVSDGCGKSLDCGTCASPETCGGGGTANVCGEGQSSDPVIVAAGDIAGSWAEDEATAQLLDSINPTGVLLLGDNAYDSGASSEFTTYFQPTWGRHLAKIFPSPGNHDHATSNLSGYCSYFGSAAHCQNGLSYYSYDLGAWHLIALDSGCSSPSSCADPMADGSAMRQWLSTDLAANTKPCTLAYWHHPRFSSGEHGNDTRSSGVWIDLYNAGVELILNGHDHNYERFSPQDANGASAPTSGIVEMVVGTGGTGLRSMGTAKANSVVQNASTHGVLKMTLHSGSLDYQFVPIIGESFADSGTIACH